MEKKTPEKPKDAESTIESKFKVGELVNFSRNEKIKSNGIKIIAVEQNKLKGFISLPTFYVIENENGFLPDKQLIIKYNLNENKRYIFVKESELIKI